MTLTLRMPLRCVHVEQALAFGGGSTSLPFRCAERQQSGTGEPENVRVRENPQGETADARGVAWREVRPWHQQSQ